MGTTDSKLKDILFIVSGCGLAVSVLFTHFYKSNDDRYTLISYKKVPRGDTADEILVLKGNKTLTVRCKSICDEFGTMAGNKLTCYAEDPPADQEHRYGVERPIFSKFRDFGGPFVCHTGEGRIFLVKDYQCKKLPLADPSAPDWRPVDADSEEISKLYCKDGEYSEDIGGKFVNENGDEMPPTFQVEPLEILEAR